MKFYRGDFDRDYSYPVKKYGEEAPVDFTIRAVTPRERVCSLVPREPFAKHVGYIGWLTGSYYLWGSWREGHRCFYSCWGGDYVPYRKENPDFEPEVDRILNHLRADPEYGKMLSCRKAMKAYGKSIPESIVRFPRSKLYVFRLDTKDHSYILSLHPTGKSYQFYVAAYVRQKFEEYLDAADAGIWFEKPDGTRLFRVENGGYVYITNAAKKKRRFRVHYVDGNIVYIRTFPENLTAHDMAVFLQENNLKIRK